MMANQRFYKFISCMGLLGLLAGCGSYVTEYRKEGFNSMQNAFASIEATPDLYEVVELKNVKIFIVGDRKHFDYARASAYGSPVAGYANTNNEIHLFGKRVNGKIVVNQAILGHELNHLLNFKLPKITDPDKLDEAGL